MQKDLALADIRIDGGTQSRPIDDDVVSRYKALIEDGAKFPPVDVVSDGGDFWLWNGFHRYHAYRKLDKKYIPASIETGTKRDATFFSFHANHDHGFPRQPGTAGKIILMILADEEWKKMSVKDIAEWVGVTRRYVEKIVAENRPQKEAEKSKSDVKMGKKNDTNSSHPNPTGGIENAESEKKPENSVLLDSVGEKVPEKLVPIFARVDEIKTHIRYLNKMLKEVKDARANNDSFWAFCKINPLEVEVKNVTRNLRFSLPYAVCRYCVGEAKDCRACNELGFVNEQSYLATAEELKKK